MGRRRPPPEIRDRLDLGYRITDQSIEIFEVRPRWDRPEQSVESPVAKATYVRAEDRWRVFWMRGDLRWHRYEPSREVGDLREFLDTVDRDEYCCFFG